ncbi:hypothetical protein LGK99_06130 [Clostridium algidicarnis]|uniref:hypothetical protein n=1 Tax=Clostridium algidicarnis TaxID=37659 RepID=UPI001CF506A3|nr:hypothetical protein [Clostridium algidicarnis]MCB2286682.1 hypothetical protein [Clostridium algidicarnis]
MRRKEYNSLERITNSILITLAYFFFKLLGDKESFENLFINIYGIKKPVKNKR